MFAKLSFQGHSVSRLPKVSRQTDVQSDNITCGGHSDNEPLHQSPTHLCLQANSLRGRETLLRLYD
jgi:hypothetical protein